MGDEILRRAVPGGEVEPVGSFGKDVVEATASFVCGTLVASRGGRAAALAASSICGRVGGQIFDYVSPRFKRYVQTPTPSNRQVYWQFPKVIQVPVPPPPRQTPPPPTGQPPNPPIGQPPNPPTGQPPSVPPPKQEAVYPTPPLKDYGHFDQAQGKWLADAFEGLYRAFTLAAGVGAGGGSGGGGGPGFVEGDGSTGAAPTGIPGTGGLLNIGILPKEFDPVYWVRQFGAGVQDLFGLGQTKIDKQKENIQDFLTTMFQFFKTAVPSFAVNDNHALQFKSKGVRRELSERPEIGMLYGTFLPDASLLVRVGIGYDKSGPGVEERIVNQFLANAANSGWTVEQTKSAWNAIVAGAKAKGV